MAAYSLETLLRRWSLHQLTTEQAIGQILQILQDLEPRVKHIEQSIPSIRKRRNDAPKPSTPPDSTNPQS